MYLVEKDLQRATAAERASSCLAACMCSVHMYNMQCYSPGDRGHRRTKRIQH